MLAVLIVVFAAAAPFAAQQSGAWAHARAHTVQLVQEASRYQVTAVLLKPTPASQPGGGVAARDPRVPARWIAPDGRPTTGEIPVPTGTTAGMTTPIWVTRDGELTSQPLQDSQVASQTLLVAILSVVALALSLAVAGALARRALDKRRLAAWDAEWRAAGPHWTTRA